MRIERHHAEGGGLALGCRAILEVRLEGEERLVGHDGQARGALHRAATGLAHADRHIGLERLGGDGEFGQRDLEIGMAVDIRLRQAVDAHLRRVGSLVHEAEAIVLPLREGLVVRADRDGGLEIEPGAGCAEEIAAIDGEPQAFRRVDARRPRHEVEGDAVGDVVLDEEGGLAHGIAIGVGIGLDAPRAALGTGRDVEIAAVAARTLVVQRFGEVADAIRSFDDEGERRAGHGVRLVVAQEHGGVHGLAAAVDAALRIDEGIDGAGCGAALDAAIGEVEGGLLEVDEAVIALRRLGDDEGGCCAAFALRQARFEQHGAGGIGLRLGQHLVVAGDEAHVCLRDGQRGGDGAERDVKPVLAAHGGEAEVGDHEPLRGARLIVRRFARGGLRGDDIETRFKLADGLIDRDGGGDLRIERRGRFQRALPHQLALLGGELGSGIAVDLAAKVRAGDAGDQVAVAHAVKRDGGFLAVHGDERNAALPGARQHIGIADEAHGGVPVADVEGECRVLGHRVVHRGGQAAAQRDGIALAIFQALDAEARALRRDGGDGAGLLRDVG